MTTHENVPFPERLAFNEADGCLFVGSGGDYGAPVACDGHLRTEGYGPEIVRRWNAHADLLAALAGLLFALSRGNQTAAESWVEIDAARSALAKARGAS